VAPLLYEK